MTDEIVAVIGTAGSQEEAEKIANALVSEGLAGCVNIIPGIRSIFMWEGKVSSESEFLLFVKTARSSLEELEKRYLELHSYSVPEFLVIGNVSASVPFTEWLLGVVKS